jgi:hypothetical protein
MGEASMWVTTMRGRVSSSKKTVKMGGTAVRTHPLSNLFSLQEMEGFLGKA